MEELLMKIKCPKCGKEEYLPTCIKLYDLELYYQCNYCFYKESIKNVHIRTDEWML